MSTRPQKKRSALDALMPDIPSKNDSEITEILPKNSVKNLNSDDNVRTRRRRQLKEKAVKITYSLYPSIIKAVERYADDKDMKYSQVLKNALMQYIPKEYFE